MAAFRTLDDIDVKGKRVLVRVDLNVPIEDGVVRDLTRIERVAPTIRELVKKGAAVIVLAHFDRPKGKVVPSMSLRPVAPALAKAIGQEVSFGDTDWQDGKAEAAAKAIRPGSILLLENTRFHPGEEKNDAALAR
ncbi:MAG: phosphoglycerate kinase, partial [Parvibaculaceae bacterium]